MKIAISAESTADLTPELQKEYDIKIVPLSVTMGDKTVLDIDLKSTQIIDFVKETKILPKTSAVNEAQFEEFFGNILKEYDAIIHFSMSGELSSTYDNAKKVSEKLKNVYVIDTRTLSTGIALLAMYACKLVKKQVPIEEIVRLCEQRKNDLQVSFVLKRLDFLYKGGRCNALQLFGANLLQLRPEIILEDGKMRPSKKLRGNMDICVKKYCEDILDRFNTADLSEAFITYTTATDKMLDNAETCLKQAGFKKIHKTTAGGTITSHCGEYCLGILYINGPEPEIKVK